MRPIGPIPLSESGGNRVGSNAIVGALGEACLLCALWLAARPAYAATYDHHADINSGLTDGWPIEL
jgi:hypothetical protein